MVTAETVNADSTDSGNTLSKLRQTLSSSLLNAQDKGKLKVQIIGVSPSRKESRSNFKQFYSVCVSSANNSRRNLQYLK